MTNKLVLLVVLLGAAIVSGSCKKAYPTSPGGGGDNGGGNGGIPIAPGAFLKDPIEITLPDNCGSVLVNYTNPPVGGSAPVGYLVGGKFDTSLLNPECSGKWSYQIRTDDGTCQLGSCGGASFSSNDLIWSVRAVKPATIGNVMFLVGKGNDLLEGKPPVSTSYVPVDWTIF